MDVRTSELDGPETPSSSSATVEISTSNLYGPSDSSSGEDLFTSDLDEPDENKENTSSQESETSQNTCFAGSDGSPVDKRMRLQHVDGDPLSLEEELECFPLSDSDAEPERGEDTARHEGE